MRDASETNAFFVVKSSKKRTDCVIVVRQIFDLMFLLLNVLELKDWLGIFAVMLVAVHSLDCVC